jgi:prevent-host-death family protein
MRYNEFGSYVPPTPAVLVGIGRCFMNILSYSEARASFKQTMDAVCRDHDPAVITRQNGGAVVMLSLSDYNSITETLYLLGSEKNAARLRSSIAQIKAGKALKRELISCGEEESETTE